jgi:hypothetical protein
MLGARRDAVRQVRAFATTRFALCPDLPGGHLMCGIGLRQRWLLVVGTLPAAALLVGCSDVSTKHIGISIVDGFAAPGEKVQLAVGTRRAMAGNIASVRVSLPSAGIVGQEVYVQPTETAGVPAYLVGDSKLWPMLRASLIADPKHPVEDVRIPLPDSARAVGRTDCAVEVTYSLAEWCGPNQFDVTSRTETLLVPLEIVGPGRVWQARLIHGGIDSGVLLLLAAAFACVLHFVVWAGVPRSANWRAGLTWLLGAAWLWASVYWAVWPICANLGLVMPLYRLTLATILPAGAFYLTYAMTARLARGLRSSSFAAQSGVVTR